MTLKLKDVVNARIEAPSAYSQSNLSFETTGGRRYHVWLKETAPGVYRFDNTLHSNPPLDTPYRRNDPNGHKALKLDAKVNRDVVDAIVVGWDIPAMVRKAREAAAAAEVAKLAAERKARADAVRAALHAENGTLTAEGPASWQAARALAEFLETATDDQLIRLRNTVGRA